MPSALERAIWRTIQLFALYPFAPTVFEVHKWLIQPDRSYDLKEVSDAITNSEWLHRRITTKHGFIAPQDAEHLIEDRQDRFLDGVRKFKKVRRVRFVLRLIPFIKGVAICNTLSWMNTTKTSDIDFFIITKSNSVWSTRFFSVLPFFFKRPHRGGRDPLCFSFFVDEHHLNLSSVCIENDIYNAMWVQSLIPILGDDVIWESFRQANAWSTEFTPQSSFAHPIPRRFNVSGKRFTMSSPKILERLLERVQRWRFPDSIRELENTSTRVVIQNHILKFHVADGRKPFADLYRKLMNKEYASR